MWSPENRLLTPLIRSGPERVLRNLTALLSLQIINGEGSYQLCRPPKFVLFAWTPMNPEERYWGRHRRWRGDHWATRSECRLGLGDGVGWAWGRGWAQKTFSKCLLLVENFFPFIKYHTWSIPINFVLCHRIPSQAVQRSKFRHEYFCDLVHSLVQSKSSR